MRVTGEIDMATAPRLRQHVQTVTVNIVCSQVHLLDLFKITRLNEVFEIYDSLEEALAHVGDASSEEASA